MSIAFYISTVVYVYQRFFNTNMDTINYSFHAAVIIGLAAILNSRRS